MNLANKFLKRVKALQDAADLWKQEKKNPGTREKYWFVTSSMECAPEDCFKREDGLWEQKEKINTHIDGGQIKIAIWRLHPNYCCAGRPVYSHEAVKEFRAKSEMEKVLLVEDGYEFVWLWREVIMPTKNVWGMSMGPRFFQLRKDGKILVEDDRKSAFKRDCDLAIAQGGVQINVTPPVCGTKSVSCCEECPDAWVCE